MQYTFLLLLVVLLSATGHCAYAAGRILMNNSLIDSLCGVTLQYHQPVNHPLNPVLKADRPWELNANGDPYAAPFSGGVWYDESESVFKMWYSAGGGKKHGLVTCYATSTDGVAWHKPDLDVVPGTNIVDTLEHDCVTVLLDKHEVDPDKRYKMFNVRFDTPSAVSMVLKYSADGIHWTDPVAVSGDLYDRCSAYYDSFREQYVLSLKTKDADNRRARNFLAHSDPEMAVSLAHRVYGNKDDKFIKFWFSADDDDPRHPDYPDIAPAIYNHDAIAYEGVLLGQFCVWQGPENKDCVRLNVQKRNEILLGFSEDGFTWDRRDKTPFIPVARDSTAWNAGNIQSSMGSPLIVGDSLYFYYSGRYNSRPVHPSNFATGLATMRRDGFVSANADNTEGYLVTHPIKNTTPYLFINAQIPADGELTVVAIDSLGQVINTTNPIKNTDSTKLLCQWQKTTDPSDKAKDINNKATDLSDKVTDTNNKTIRLKFILKGCKLYSFWFADTTTGESHGYTSGGGPSLSPTGLDQNLR